MGSGSWDSSTYQAASSYRKATGTSAFTHTAAIQNGTALPKAHAMLDPKGVVFREARDSDEHPESLAIAVIFDETGSMGHVPAVLVEKLQSLFGLLLRKGYVEHPQILMGAVGDSHTDPYAPLQMGQFESDNRIDETLGNIYLEGNGGGTGQEGYELVPYFMARHTAIDCFEKRGHKGYLFVIGDEDTYPMVEPRLVEKWIGDKIDEPIPVQAIFDECAEKYEIFRIEPSGSSHHGETHITSHWRELVGAEHVIQLEDLDAVSETIALTIGMLEGAIDLADGLTDLVDVGSTAGKVVSKALAPLGASRGSVAKSAVPAGMAAADDSVARI